MPVPEDQAPQGEVANLARPGPVGEMDVRVAVVGLLGQQPVDPGLHLRGHAGERKPAAGVGRARRAPPAIGPPIIVCPLPS